MPSSPDTVSASAVRPPRSFIRPDRSCYHDTSWTAWAISMKLTGNIH